MEAKTYGKFFHMTDEAGEMGDGHDFAIGYTHGSWVMQWLSGAA